MALELPQRWGKDSEFEGGKATVNCSTIPIAERCFTSSPHLTLKHAAWYPSEMLDPHIVLLTSDNVIRIYSLREPQTPTKVIVLSEAEEERPTGSCASLGAIVGRNSAGREYFPPPGPQRIPIGRKGRNLGHFALLKTGNFWYAEAYFGCLRMLGSTVAHVVSHLDQLPCLRLPPECEGVSA